MAIEINATIRRDLGKNANRKIRGRGKIPAVLYSPYREALPIELDRQELEKVISLGGARKILDMNLKADDKTSQCQILVKDIQRDALSGDFLHLDLYEIKIGQEIYATVPIKLDGKPFGVREQSGAVQFLTRNVRIKCLPRNLPEYVPVVVDDLKIGESLHIKDIDSKSQFTVIDEPERVIVSVISVKAAITEVEAEEETEAEAASEEQTTE
ncbi:50S ribosomal protein L25 [bacterium]|nr:50S ribosomal protein L25 [candidate division CSSED10-310 bacterium]